VDSSSSSVTDSVLSKVHCHAFSELAMREKKFNEPSKRPEAR